MLVDMEKTSVKQGGTVELHVVDLQMLVLFTLCDWSRSWGR